jgi:predicted permease
VRILLEDLRLGVRRLWQQPGFTAVAVLMLALGLGANTTIFTLVQALLMPRLPVEQGDELYRLGDNNNCCNNSGLQRDFSLFSYALYQHLRDNLPEFSSLAAFMPTVQALGVRRDGDDYADSFPVQIVTGNYFTMFGVRPAAGRLLADTDDRPDAPPAFVMSHRIWTDRYDRDPAVIGRQFFISGKPLTLVGVATEGFFGDTVRPDPAAIWIPIGQEPMLRGAASVVDRPSQYWLYAIGRAVPGATREGIQLKATALLQQWLSGQSFVSTQDRSEIPQQRIAVASARGGVQLMRYTFAQPLNLLFITSGLVLLIAAANLANLLLARADRGQAALRAALGASRARLIRQALTEGVLLAVIGGVAGVLVAIAATRTLLALAFPGASVVPVATTPSVMVLLFAFGLSVLTGAIFTAAPAWAMSRAQPIDALHGVGRSSVSRSFVPRRSLVVVQVALSMVLLTGAGLLATSLNNLERQPLGFDPERRIVLRIDPPSIADAPDKLSALYLRMREELLRVPGVESVSYALYSPMEGNNWSSGISIQGRAVDPARPISSSWNRIGPAYFETIGTRLLRGRAIDERDTPGSAHVAVVNAAFVRQFFDKDEPLGRRVGIGGPGHAGDFEIVGVVEDVKYTGASRPTRPMFFVPTMQVAGYDDASDRNVQARSTLMKTVIIRTASEAASLESMLRRTLANVDRGLTVLRVLPLADQVGVNFRLERLMARLTTAYGALALMLASIGLYGVTAYAVARRTREIGVRMALGADRSDIMKVILRGPLFQTAIGLVVGAPLAWFAGRAISTQLYGISGGSPFILTAAMVTLVLSAAVAAIVPARRAASVDPTRALRME